MSDTKETKPETKQAKQSKVQPGFQVGYYRALLLHDANRVQDEFIASGKTSEIKAEGGKFHVYAYTK